MPLSIQDAIARVEAWHETHARLARSLPDWQAAAAHHNFAENYAAILEPLRASLELLDALYSALNLEGPALAAVRNIPAHLGLDAPYHFTKMRNAIAKAEGRA